VSRLEGGDAGSILSNWRNGSSLASACPAAVRNRERNGCGVRYLDPARIETYHHGKTGAASRRCWISATVYRPPPPAARSPAHSRRRCHRGWSRSPPGIRGHSQGRTQTVVATPVRILFIGDINSSSARLVFPAQGLPWPAIESRCHCGYVVGAVNAQVCAFREVLPLPAQWESTDPSPRRQGRLGRTDVGHGRIAEAASGIERRPAVVLLGRSIRGRQMSFSRRSTASFQNASGTV
jgi:hypothetical protein